MNNKFKAGSWYHWCGLKLASFEYPERLDAFLTKKPSAYETCPNCKGIIFPSDMGKLIVDYKPLPDIKIEKEQEIWDYFCKNPDNGARALSEKFGVPAALITRILNAHLEKLKIK